MLLDELYTINDFQYLEKETILVKININDQHEIFKGHFPGRPVMPGVCIINMLTDILSESKKERYFLKSADFIKFIHLIQPGTNSYIYVRLAIISEIENNIKVEASVFFENIVFLKFKGCFEKLEG